MPSTRSTTQQQQHQRPQRQPTIARRPQPRPQPTTPKQPPSRTTPATPASQQLESPQQHKAFPFVTEDVLRPIDGLHRPVGLVVLSALLLETAVQLTGVGPGVPLLAAGVGASVGGLYAGLNRVGVKRLWTAPTRPLNVVITGSTKGIGKALAREFLRYHPHTTTSAKPLLASQPTVHRAGDRVVVTSRSITAVQSAMAELREELPAGASAVFGIDCDVSSEASVARLADFAASQMGRVDVWINNAGYSGSYKPFLELSPSAMSQVVSTNLMGSLLCTQAAMRVMQAQQGGGHVFNMDGAGADGMPTPMYAAYGATKAGVAHLMTSLVREADQLATPVGVHTLSPGMVLTELLLEGATQQNKQVFNILCEQPETIAAYLVPRVRTVAARSVRSSYIKYLTTTRALSFFLSAPARAGRYFDSGGNAVYASERERVLGDAAKRTERLADKAARRTTWLALAYSASLAASYLVFMTVG